MKSQTFVASVFAVCVLVHSHVASAQSGPPASAQQVADAVTLSPAIPADAVIQPNWDSVQSHFAVPQWFADAKFGIMMHWGIYSAPAKHNEWDLKYMYGANAGIGDWYTANFGPRTSFGYLDFLDPSKTAIAGSPAAAYYHPFTAEHFDSDAWTALFKQSGAKIISIIGQHHDGFSLWDSQVNPFNTKNFGPHRDLVGDLGASVRKAGIKFGIQDHGIENYTFISQVGTPTSPNDFESTITTAGGQVLKRKDYYLPGSRTFAGPVTDPVSHFLDNWYSRDVELIDKYQPDLLWFDNGINSRTLDPIKTKLAAYYYNKALGWKKQVTLTGKGNDGNEAFLKGGTHDHEKMNRAPTTIQKTPWLVHDTITKGTSWAYNKIDQPGLSGDAGRNIRLIVHVTSLNGTFLLNIAPMSDGTIPPEQVEILKGIGAWMETNGEAIYGTRPWTQNFEGSNSAGASASTAFRFTTKDKTLYAIMMGWPTEGSTAAIKSLGSASLKDSTIQSVQLLGHGPVTFTREANQLTINLPAQPAGNRYAYAFKIEGTGLVP